MPTIKTPKGGNYFNCFALQLGKIGEVSFSFQTFSYREEEVELACDLRIVQLGNDFYAFYSKGAPSIVRDLLYSK